MSNPASPNTAETIDDQKARFDSIRQISPYGLSIGAPETSIPSLATIPGDALKAQSIVQN